MITAQKRLLPNFLIVGAAKGGTTSLYSMLDMHPNIIMSRRKEPHFFSRNYEKGERYYRSFFPLMTSEKVTGEASVSYLTDASTPKRVTELIPEAKIIMLLRDPLIRAYSHYQMLCESHPIKESFSELMDEEIRQRKTGIKTKYGLIENGMYAKSIENWLQFIKRENILIIQSEQFAKEPLEVMKKVYEFIGVENIGLKETLHKNSRKYQELSTSEYSKYEAVFEEDGKRLHKFISL